MEESAESLAFASEPVMLSLANILAARQEAVDRLFAEAKSNSTTGGSGSQQDSLATSTGKEIMNYYAKDYEFLDIEMKYGLLQVRSSMLIRRI
jgi:SCY1-like protein 2